MHVEVGQTYLTSFNHTKIHITEVNGDSVAYQTESGKKYVTNIATLERCSVKAWP